MHAQDKQSRSDHLIHAVAFDLDGLMINSEDMYRQVGAEMLERRGRRATPKLFAEMMGRTNREALQIMIDWHHLEDTVDDLQAETDVLLNELMKTSLRAMPGLLDLLAKIDQRRLPRAVTTSARRTYLHDVLSRLELSGFAFHCSAEDVQRGKPNPEMYLAAAERFGISPARMLVLEDSDNGCQAAVAAGACTIAVPSVEGGEFHGARLVAESLADPRIIEWLDRYV